MPNLKEGETLQVKGSGSAVHTIKYTGGVFSCSCPAWRNQSKSIDQRTCKHILAQGFTSDTMVQVEAGEASLPEPPAEKDVPPVLLAHSWDNAQDLTGWWVSEKLDGVRCWWDGERFISRLGNVYYAPPWFLRQLPRVELDGELWIGRKKFQETVSVVRKAVPVDAEWGNVLFMVFDLPTHGGSFEERHAAIRERIGTQPNIRRVDQVRCTSLDQIKAELDLVVSQGGEGLMARQPGSKYEAGRSNTLLKLKTFYDAEAIVEGYEPGKGKHKGKVGSLMCVTTWGAHFKVGTGLSDHERANPPKIGTTITYRYQELSKDQIPRFPSFVAVRSYE